MVWAILCSMLAAALTLWWLRRRRKRPLPPEVGSIIYGRDMALTTWDPDKGPQRRELSPREYLRRNE